MRGPETTTAIRRLELSSQRSGASVWQHHVDGPAATRTPPGPATILSAAAGEPTQCLSRPCRALSDRPNEQQRIVHPISRSTSSSPEGPDLSTSHSGCGRHGAARLGVHQHRQSHRFSMMNGTRAGTALVGMRSGTSPATCGPTSSSCQLRIRICPANLGRRIVIDVRVVVLDRGDVLHHGFSWGVLGPRLLAYCQTAPARQGK
jgi:hypothetical protein